MAGFFSFFRKKKDTKQTIVEAESELKSKKEETLESESAQSKVAETLPAEDQVEESSLSKEESLEKKEDVVDVKEDHTQSEAQDLASKEQSTDSFIEQENVKNESEIKDLFDNLKQNEQDVEVALAGERDKHARDTKEPSLQIAKESEEESNLKEAKESSFKKEEDSFVTSQVKEQSLDQELDTQSKEDLELQDAKNNQENLQDISQDSVEDKVLTELKASENVSEEQKTAGVEQKLEDTNQDAQNLQDTDKSDVANVEEERSSFFSRLKKTRENLAYGISAFVKGREIDEDLYEDLETALLTADLGVDTTAWVIEKLRVEAKVRELHDASLLKKRLKKILTSLLEPCEQALVPETSNGMPYVILMVGVNGAGKTTTIGKLAQKYLAQGKKVMLAAGDTFRAAAVEQLKEWGQRANVPVVAQSTGADSASVLYDALSSAIAKKVDILICDTAGRLQNKDHLMNELKKIVKVMKKIDENVPHEVLLVLDAATGQNAVSQTKLFKDAVGVTGLCLTKLDGSAKGGVVFSLAKLYQLPIRFVGIGEKAQDLREFKAKVFVDALVDD